MNELDTVQGKLRKVAVMSFRSLTNVLRVDHGTLGLLLVDHVFLGELQVQVGAALLVTGENRPVNIHAFAIVGGLFVLLLILFSLISFELLGRRSSPSISVKHLHFFNFVLLFTVLFMNSLQINLIKLILLTLTNNQLIFFTHTQTLK